MGLFFSGVIVGVLLMVALGAFGPDPMDFD